MTTPSESNQEVIAKEGEARGGEGRPWTQGPWDVAIRVGDSEHPMSVIAGKNSGRAVAVAMCPHYGGQSWWPDARLIAAAPELFDALAEILEYRGGADNALLDDYVMERAQAAVAKALATTNEQPVIGGLS